MEMSKEKQWNPILQDTKKGVLRTIKYHPFVWNYGFFPQTWEDPGVVAPDTGLAGRLLLLLSNFSNL